MAVSDELNITAQPLDFLERKTEIELLRDIAKLISQYAIFEIVVGLPRHMSGDMGKGAKDAVEFSRTIEKEFGIKAALWDERLTTVCAQRALKEMGVKGKRKRKIIDSLSAQMILQSYLNSKSTA